MKPKLRSINTNFWYDSYVAELNRDEKLLFLYLLSNPHLNIAGVFEVPLRNIVFDTGISEKVILKAFEKFEKDGKVFYVDSYIILMNYVKNQSYSDTMKKGAIEIINQLPEKIKKIVSKRNNNGLVSLSQPIDSLREEEEEVEEEREVEKEEEEEPPPLPDYDFYLETWNKFAGDYKLSKIKTLTKARKDKIRLRNKEPGFNFAVILSVLAISKFALGENERGWKVDFDFVINSESNYTKILEGKYKNGFKQANRTGYKGFDPEKYGLLEEPGQTESQ